MSDHLLEIKQLMEKSESLAQSGRYHQLDRQSLMWLATQAPRLVAFFSIAAHRTFHANTQSALNAPKVPSCSSLRQCPSSDIRCSSRDVGHLHRTSTWNLLQTLISFILMMTLVTEFSCSLHLQDNNYIYVFLPDLA